MTKPHDLEQTELRDAACLAVEQFNYMEALFSALADQMNTLGIEDRKVRDAKRLALLGRSHAEQWACTFLGEMNG